MTVILTISIIAFLVLVHEWGHFKVARKVGVPVHEFSIGFGKKIFGFRKDGVNFSLRIIPLGGYVRMAGEEKGDFDDPNGYNNCTPLQKIAVAAAGPFMNLIIAAVIFVLIYSIVGLAQPSSQPVIGDIIPGQPAEQAGLKAGDIVLQVNQNEVTSWQNLVSNIQACSDSGENIELLVQRNQEKLDISLTPVYSSEANKYIIGVYNSVEFKSLGVWEALSMGFKQAYRLSVLILSGLGMLFTGNISSGDIAGPVGIANMVGTAAQGGWSYLLSFAAFLSINLAWLNLFPIPALDGSKILFAIIEAVRGKKIDPEKEGTIHLLGFMFLIGLIVFATYNDILRLIRG